MGDRGELPCVEDRAEMGDYPRLRGQLGTTPRAEHIAMFLGVLEAGESQIEVPAGLVPPCCSVLQWDQSHRMAEQPKRKRTRELPPATRRV